MADNSMDIKLSIDFEEYGSVEKKLNNLIKQLQNNNKFKIDFDIQNLNIQDINRQVEQLSQNIQSKIMKTQAILNDSSQFSRGIQENIKNIDKYTEKVKQAQGMSTLTSTVAQGTNDLNQAVRVTEQLDNKTGEVKSRVIETTDEYAKQEKTLQSSLDKLSQYQNKLQTINTGYNLKNGVQDDEHLSDLNAKYNEIINTINKYKESETTLSAEQKRDIQSQIADLQNLVVQYKDVEKTAEKGFNFQQFKDISSEVVKLKSAQDAYNTSLLEGNRVIKATVQETGDYYKVNQELQKGNQFTTLSAYIDKATGKTYEFNKSMRDGMNDTITWSKALSTAFTRVIQWFGATTLIIGGFNALKTAISDVVELDSQFADLKITMNGTDDNFKQLGIDSQKMAIELGTSVNSVMEVAKVYANMNENVASILAKTKSSVALSTISGISTSETTNAIQSIIEQFQLADQEASTTSMHISDSLVAISKNMSMNFSQGIQEMVKGIQVVGSVASQQGKMTEEQTSAMIGAIVERTRTGGETVANGLKTIMARTYQSKSIDPDVSDEDMSNASKALGDLQISVRDATGAYRPFNQILQDISKSEEHMSDSQKANLSYILAGVRQANIFTSAIQTVGKAEEYTNDAMNSNNETLIANSKYQDTVKAKWEELKATWTSIAQQSLNSDSLKIFVENLISLSNAIGVVIKQFGLIPSAVGVLSGLFFALNKEFRDFVQNSNIMGIGTIKKAFDELSESINAKIVFTKKNIIADEEAGVATGGLKASLIGLTIEEGLAKVGAIALQTALTMGLSIAITWLIQKITELANASQQARQEQEATISNIKEEQDTINSMKEDLSTLNDLNSKTTKTTEEKQKLSDINNKLASEYPDLISHYDAENKQFTISIEKLNEKIAQEDKLMARKNANAIAQAKLDADEAQRNLKSKESELNKGKKETAGYSSGSLGFGTSASGAEVDMNTKDKTKLIKDIQDEQIALDNANKIINQGTGIINDYINAYVKEGDTLDVAKEKIKLLGYSEKDINDAMKLSTNSIKDNTDAMSKNKNITDNTKSKLQSVADVEKDLATKMKDAKSQISSINEVLADHAKNNQWNRDKVLELAETYPDLLDKMNDDKALEQALIQKRTEATNSAMSNLNSQIQMEAQYINQVAGFYGYDVTQFKNKEEAKNAILQSGIKKRIEMFKQEVQVAMNAYNASMSAVDRDNAIRGAMRAGDLMGQAEYQYDDIGVKIDDYYKLKDLAGSIGNSLSNYGSGSSSSDSDKSAEDAVKKLEELESQALSAIQDIESKIRSVIEHQIEVEKKAIDDRLTNEKNFITEKQKLLEDSYTKEDYDQKMHDENKKKLDIQAKIDALKADSSAEAEAMRNELQSQLEDQQRVIDDAMKDRNRTLQKSALDTQLSDAEKQADADKLAIDAKYSTENVNNMIKNAMATGTLFGDSLATSLVNFEKEFGTDVTLLNNGLQSFITTIQSALKLFAGLKGDGTIDPSVLNSVPINSKGYAESGVVTQNELAMLHGGTAGTEVVLNGKDATNFIYNMAKMKFTPPVQIIEPIRLPKMIDSIGKGKLATISFANLINIEGNADTRVIPKIEEIADKVCDKLRTQIQFN